MDWAPPYVTAWNWVIFDRQTGKLLFGKFENERWEIASLTKLMVAFTVIRICENLKIDVEKEMIWIEGECLDMNGTSAKLREGDHLTIKSLLYALLLPSGNDAGYLLADHFGTLLYTKKLTWIEKQSQKIVEEEFNSSFSSMESFSNMYIDSKYLAWKS